MAPTYILELLTTTTIEMTTKTSNNHSATYTLKDSVFIIVFRAYELHDRSSDHQRRTLIKTMIAILFFCHIISFSSSRDLTTYIVAHFVIPTTSTEREA